MINTFQILGMSAGKPQLDQSVSSYMISCSTYDIMIDCGEGTYLEWLKHKYSWDKLRYIFITHLHPDHIGGLINLLFYKKLSNSNTPIIIYGPKKLKEYVDLNLIMQNINLSYSYKILTNPKFEKLNDDIFVKSAVVKHSVKCLSYRFNALNFSIVIATDTLPTDNTIDLASNCDILVHECTFLNDNLEKAKQTYHSTLNDALYIAEKAKAKRLILSHFGNEIKNKIDNVSFNNQKCIINNIRINCNG